MNTALDPKQVRERTEHYYSRFCNLDLQSCEPGIHFVCSPEREEELKGFGCRYSLYILARGDSFIVSYAPKHSETVERWKGLGPGELLSAAKTQFPLHEMKLFCFAGETRREFGGARALTEADYPLFEDFFRATQPDGDPEGWLREYFCEKAGKGYITGLVRDERLVSVCDAPDMPYMEDLVQHTGIMTLPEERGKGYAAHTAALATHQLLSLGVCPQWECETENLGSAAVARAIGHRDYGTAYILEEYA